jgi:hypothetical protein
MKKNYTFYLEPEHVNQLNQIVIFPVSKSILLDEIIAYLMKSPWILEQLMTNKLEQIKNTIDSIPE